MANTGLDQVATAHGWKGALGYRSAKSVLHGCNWDDKVCCLVMAHTCAALLETPIRHGTNAGRTRMAIIF
jgi:hypothetical protein